MGSAAPADSLPVLCTPHRRNRWNNKCKGPEAGLCLVVDLTQELKEGDPGSSGSRERRITGL